nr:MAG TPA: hypothetical protein [Bacteriophage sp.]
MLLVFNEFIRAKIQIIFVTCQKSWLKYQNFRSIVIFSC